MLTKRQEITELLNQLNLFEHSEEVTKLINETKYAEIIGKYNDHKLMNQFLSKLDSMHESHLHDPSEEEQHIIDELRRKARPKFFWF